jgi:hypothetical protein
LHDLSDLDTAIHQLLARGVGVGDHQLQATHRTWRHFALRREVTDHNRATRARRRQLRDVHVLSGRVVVQVKADLVTIEGDRPIDVADRQDHDFQGPIHAAYLRTPLACS